MISHNVAPFVFVVDTTDYAGNFERPMCAYITGLVGDCGVGKAEAETARRQLTRGQLSWFRRFVKNLPDGHGCARPCGIWPTPGLTNSGFGEVMPDNADPAEVRARFEASARREAERARNTNWESSYREEALRRADEDLER